MPDLDYESFDDGSVGFGLGHTCVTHNRVCQIGPLQISRPRQFGMVLSPVSNRDWIDPPWNISNPDPEGNVLTSLRLKNERGRGRHKVEEPALQQFFVSLTTNIVSKLSEEESTKIDFNTISSSCELKSVYVTINQCTVSSAPCLCAPL